VRAPHLCAPIAQRAIAALAPPAGARHIAHDMPLRACASRRAAPSTPWPAARLTQADASTSHAYTRTVFCTHSAVKCYRTRRLPRAINRRTRRGVYAGRLWAAAILPRACRTCTIGNCVTYVLLRPPRGEQPSPAPHATHITRASRVARITHAACTHYIFGLRLLHLFLIRYRAPRAS